MPKNVFGRIRIAFESMVSARWARLAANRDVLFAWLPSTMV